MMKRRKFLTTTAAASSACAITGGVVLAGTSTANDEKKKVTKCKITVLKKGYDKELFQTYKDRDGKPCPLFEIGQEIIVNKWWNCPEGFCNWAWADIRPYIQQIFSGTEKTVSCCTDGFRPVVFLLERIEEEKTES